jgi:hypothetical protein
MELLVHISAPTTKKDDDRYRAQALAYSNFKPAVRHGCERAVPTPREQDAASISIPKELDIIRREEHQTCLQQLPSAVITRKRKMPSSNVSPVMTPIGGHRNGPTTTPLGKLEVMQTLWKSRQKPSSTLPAQTIVDIPDTQRIFSTQLAMAALETQVSSYCSSSSSIPISSLTEKRATKRLRTSQQSLSVAPSNSNSQQPHTSVLETSQSNAQALELNAADTTPDQADIISSQLPDTYNLSKSDEISSVHTPVLNEYSQSYSASFDNAPEPLSPTTKTSYSVKAARSKSFQLYRSAVDSKTYPKTKTWSSQPLPVKSGKENIQPIPEANPFKHSLTCQPPERIPKPKQTTLQQPRSSIPSPLPPSLLQQLFSLPKQVLPPTPPTSHTPAAEATFIDSTLQKLASVSELRSRYSIRHQQLRPVSKFERGYWRIDARDWPLHHQILFWQKLVRFVGNGVVGLATSCFRQADEGEESLGIVKVFCWGEIVMHVYLFIYSCGRKEMRKQSATWVDVDGKVVVSISTVLS